ncbi:alpha/beta hydrolase [Rhodoferax sp.]|uniref:alpha/beta hydrolase n=1 Tax=Rhodoferax sp. TaxID=50421 RepID=UPI001ECB3DC0|nr:alpha/beta hydrolase [Rhodoferax sp.]MBT9505148.1 alpha/beta hydrolase [Rhodoferax sp.]
MSNIIWGLLALAAIIWAIEIFYLRGKNLSVFDQPAAQGRFQGSATSEAYRGVLSSLDGIAATLQSTPRSQHIALLRNYMNNAFPSNESGIQIIAVDAGGVPAEWVLAPNADPRRRLLYIHGGAYTMGSPQSHRRLTSKFSEIANAAVLAIDYRLMPEYPRMAGIEDSRTGYRWLLDNGPTGLSPASAVFVAGDSAGGNLTLSLIAWVRDQGLRAPNAAVALSPATDATLGSPSLKNHIETDPMLGPLFKSLAKIPRSVLLWAAWLQTRIRPSDPVVSPVYGDLSRLPPVLLHASESEMLFDDSLRYVNKAVAAGSPVTLQTWSDMVHVWHIFHPELPEARDALENIRKFFQAHG